jgi:hypothetical protein
MLRRSLSLSLLLSTALAPVLFACSGGTTTTSSSSGEPSPFASSSSSTEPAPDKGTSGSSGTKGSALGASCKAYVACCEEVATSQPQLAASCDSVKTQIESAQSKGASTSSYESACKSGLSGFQSAGYCK